MQAAPSDAALAERTTRRITRRLMPFLFCLYFIAYLDRVNVSFAGLEMTRELGLTPQQFGFAAGIFFLGYFLLEIPGAVIVETWSARKWIARIMITWGFIAAATGLATSAMQLYVLRFCLGLAEAGFFPGMIVYLSHWFRPADRAKAVAMFMIAIPISEIIGAPMSAALMKLDWLGLSGWRWLLILEGLPAVILGVVVLFYLTDRPKDAKWLSPEQRDWITAELAKDQSERRHITIWQGLRSPSTLLLMFAYFALMNVNYGIIMWLPKILHSIAGESTTRTILLTAIPFLIGTPVVLAIGWRSDRKMERRWHAAAPLLIGVAALLIFPQTLTNLPLTIALFTLAVIGVQSAKAPFWAIATTILGGKAAAASIGLINSFGNLGGFAGPYSIGFLTTRTNSFESGVLFMAAAATLAAILILCSSSKSSKVGQALLPAADFRPPSIASTAAHSLPPQPTAPPVKAD